MKMIPVIAGATALALVAGCTAQQVQVTNAALASAEAVASDLVGLEQQVQAGGVAVSPAEMAALTKAIADATSGVAALTNNSSSAATVLAKVQMDIAALEPFVPSIVAVIGALAAPAPGAAVPAVSYPAVAHLAVDMAKLRAAAGA
jgi:hypothetical protein